MTIAIAALSMLFAISPASDARAAMPDWSVDVPSELRRTVDLGGMPDFVKVRAAHRARRADALRRQPRQSRSSASSRNVLVADAQTWQKLIERGKRSPEIEDVDLNGVVYRFHVIDTNKPVDGQKCAAGTQVDNTLYVYDGLPQSPGDEVYPVRLAAECINNLGAPDALSVDTDADGKILNTDWIKGVSDEHPTFDPDDHSARNTRDRAFLKGLIDLFLDLP